MTKIIILLFFFTSIFSKEICILNFNKQVCKEFKLLDSVIIKSSLSKKELSLKLSKELKQIAFLEKYNIFLVNSINPLEFSKELSKKSYIVYAQPNIIQKREKNFQKSYKISNKYNLHNIWKTTKGEGVNIAIIDDGFDLGHEDLKGLNLLFSYDADNKRLDASPQLKMDTHGTQVLGIIFAQHNGIGIDGIAPKANLIAIRQTKNITSDTIISFSVAQKVGANIINCSWNSPLLLEPIYDIIKHLSKKIAIVFAAGNNARELQPFSTEASIDEVITVATNNKYSNYGENIDFILSSNIKTTKRSNQYGNFNGTSAVAPVVSGLLALKISQKTDIDLQEIIHELKEDYNFYD